MTCSNPVQEKIRHNPLPSRRSMTGPRMPSAVWATSDLEMAWPWPPPFTSDNCLPICFTELSTFPRKLKMDSVQLPYEPMYRWLGGRLVGWLGWWLDGWMDGWSVGRMVGRSYHYQIKCNRNQYLTFLKICEQDHRELYLELTVVCLE